MGKIEFQLILSALALLMTLPLGAAADEGMWLFNNPPSKHLKDKYGFEFPDGWLENVQKASVRFNSGGSGSFVSPQGLVMTNHHVAADAIQKLSSKENNYLRDGFHAKSREQELKCVDLELNVLMSIEDVTAKVEAAVKEGLSGEEAFKARNEVIARIEKESLEETGLRSNVTTLYQGGQYHLYRFKRYTDIRLSFAPEQQAAFFGGDPDNFEYPRYCYDVAFFRVYEDDKPVQPKHYLKWSKDGSKEGDLVFVSGHPGRTSRLNTVAELEYLRDHAFPFLMQRLHRMEINLSVYGSESQENARQAQDELFGIQNSRKARTGGLAGLLDPNIMGNKQQAEKKLREAVASDPKLEDVRGAWDTIAKLQKQRAELARPYTMLEAGAAFNTTYFGIGRTLLRAAEELPKPNGDRLREFQDSNIESLKQQLFSAQPIYDEMEIVKLTDSLTFFIHEFGYTHPLVQKVLAGKSPSERAAELINGTKLRDVDFRQKLFEGGKSAIASASDPIIELATMVDEESRKLRKTYENEVEELKTQAYAKIAKAKYAVEGDSTYPDATFTLRLAFGEVKGYTEAGKQIPPFTQMGGKFERAAEQGEKEPFNLPERWVERKDKLNLKTPYNFVCTADIIGGNSGSPVINRDAEIVGIIFDGNIQSLVLDFVYSDEVARAVSVDSRAIIEALRSVYDADALVKELTGGR